MEIISDENMISTSIQKRRTSGRWNLNRRSRNVAARNLPIVGDSALSEALRSKKLAPITLPCHFVLKYMIPSMLALVALKYQGETENLFVKNPTPLWCFLVAICVYWVIVGGTKQRPSLKSKYLRIFSRFAFATGLLSALSLLSVLLPKRFRVVPFIIWIATLPLILAWPMLYAAFTWLCSPIKTLCNRTKSVSREATLPV